MHWPGAALAEFASVVIGWAGYRWLDFGDAVGIPHMKFMEFLGAWLVLSALCWIAGYSAESGRHIKRWEFGAEKELTYR